MDFNTKISKVKKKINQVNKLLTKQKEIILELKELGFDFTIQLSSKK